MRLLIILREARKDISQIRKFTSHEWGLKQSQKYLKELFDKMALINQNPNLGLIKEDVSQTTYVFPHKSHMIYYYFTNTHSFIVRVLHQSMLPKNHLQDRLT